MADIVFQGPSALTLDSKGRIAVPVRHRDVLTRMAAATVTVTKNPPGGLLIFPPAVWADFSARVAALPMESSGWKRLFLGNAVEVEIDASSRLLVAPELRTFADLSRDVMLLGMGNYLELWDKRRYDEHESQVVASPMPDSIKNFIL